MYEENKQKGNNLRFPYGSMEGSNQFLMYIH